MALDDSSILPHLCHQLSQFENSSANVSQNCLFSSRASCLILYEKLLLVVEQPLL